MFFKRMPYHPQGPDVKHLKSLGGEVEKEGITVHQRLSVLPVYAGTKVRIHHNFVSKIIYYLINLSVILFLPTIFGT